MVSHVKMLHNSGKLKAQKMLPNLADNACQLYLEQFGKRSSVDKLSHEKNKSSLSFTSVSLATCIMPGD